MIAKFYDEYSRDNFSFKYLCDENGMFQFNVSGYLHDNTAIITDVQFYLFNGEDDYLEIKGAKNINNWFQMLGADKVLNGQLLQKFGTTVAEFKF